MLTDTTASCHAALLVTAALLALPALAAAQTWQPVALRTQAALEAGVDPGGEGGQWPQAIAVDARDGRFLLFGTDVGGIYRSLDGGALWEPCNVGYTPRGNCGFAIDPHDPRRCIAVGANSAPGDWHGLYLSTDQASSWRHVLPQGHRGYRDMRDQIAYDPTSAAGGYTRVVYYSSQQNGLYRSSDGGETWEQIQSEHGDCWVKVHPTRGSVYIAGERGFFVSTDGAASFERTLDTPLLSMAVSAADPDRVYVVSEERVWTSGDGGRTFSPTQSSGLPNVHLRFISASPADADRLVVFYQGPNWDWRRYRSLDGGATWERSSFDNSRAFLPYNAREGLSVWHPTDPNVVWSFGGDWITVSTDAGATWRWSGNGYNGVLVGGAFNFCAYDPDVLFFGSQDYNSALTTDGGRTWRYCNVSGNGWGGFCYGGYAASAQVMYAGDSDSWGGQRYLRISRDGGQSFGPRTVKLSRPDVSCGDPIDPNVLFCANQRSEDGGNTWSPMQGCDAVLTHAGTTLYGRDGKSLVASDDSGRTWRALATCPEHIADVACDPQRNVLYVACGGRLRRWDGTSLQTVETPPDQFGDHRVTSVAVDPTDPSIVYAASHKDVYCTSASLIRSADAGETWDVLTVNEPLDGKVRDGGREAIWVRVHPRTREAWVSTSCYGIWKIGPPE